MDLETIVLINDLHVPFQDRETLDLVYKAIKDIDPDKLLIGGDLIDFYSISHFEKDPRRKLHLGEEISETMAELLRIRKAAPNAQIVFFKGNHEERLQKYILRNAKELIWLEDLDLPRILRLKSEFGIQWVDSRGYQYKGVLFSHYDKANKYGGYTAKNLGVDLGRDLVHAHSHKVGKVRVRDRTFYDNGCLCTLDAHWLKAPSTWAQAFMVIEHSRGKNYFNQVDIQGGKFSLDGKIYGQKKKRKK